MHLSKFIYGFLWFVTLICQNWYMVFSQLLHGFVKVFLWISPFAKLNQVEVWPRCPCLLKPQLWTKGVEWVKVRNALCLLCLWQCLVDQAIFTHLGLLSLLLLLSFVCWILFHFLSKFLWVLILTVLLLSLHFRLLSFILLFSFFLASASIVSLSGIASAAPSWHPLHFMHSWGPGIPCHVRCGRKTWQWEWADESNPILLLLFS